MPHYQDCGGDRAEQQCPVNHTVPVVLTFLLGAIGVRYEYFTQDNQDGGGVKSRCEK